VATQIHFKLAKLLLPPMLIAVSSWGLWDLMRTEADMPSVLAALLIAGFDLCAVGFACLSLETAADGHPPLPWNLMIWLLTAVSAVIQFFHGWGQGWAWYACLVMTFFPICGVLFITGHLRLQYRRTVDMPSRVSLSPWVWMFDRPLAMQLTRASVLDGHRTPLAIEPVTQDVTQDVTADEEEPPKLSAVSDSKLSVSAAVKQLVDAGHSDIDSILECVELELARTVDRATVARLVRRFRPKEVAA
jgi:hypothetical protein